MDKESIDNLTKKFYQLFTNIKGIKPNVEGVYQLFIPEGLIIKNSDLPPIIYNPKQFVEPRIALLTNGSLIDFSEYEIFEKTEILGNIAHRFSIYEKSGILLGKSFESKGVKSFQFIKTLDGWKISSLAWDDERDGLCLPDDYKTFL